MSFLHCIPGYDIFQNNFQIGEECEEADPWAWQEMVQLVHPRQGFGMGLGMFGPMFQDVQGIGGSTWAL